MYSPDRYAALVDAIESLDEGVCVASRDGRVLYQNRAFHALPNAGPDGRAIKDAIKDARRIAIARALGADGEGHARSTSFAVEARTGLVGYRVRCTVVRRAPNPTPHPETIVIWVRTVASNKLTLADLQHRFGLTAREAHTAVLLESGARTREIAESLGISVHTARRHTEAALKKLDVRSRLQVRQRLLRTD